MSDCPHCGQPGTTRGAFCQFCGGALRPPALATPRPISCPSCRTENPPGTNFCFACGTRQSDDGTPVLGSSADGAPSSPRPALARAIPALADDTDRRGPTRAASAVASARLVVVRRDGTDGASYPISSEQFDIGRSEGDLLFDDPHMAARHARIVERAGAHVLVPLESRNGVFLRIQQPVDLTDTDHVLLGKQVLRFELLPDVERTLRPAVEHGVVLFGTPLKAPWGRLRQLTAAGTCRDVYHLARSEIVLGREQGDIVFSDDEFLSRRHAQLQFRAGRVTLVDLGSSNGTYVRLRTQHALLPGEMIRMGDELLRFDIG